MYGIIPGGRREASIFSLLDDIERSFFSPSIQGNAQFRCDISEKDGGYLLEAELPGFDKEDINIDVNDSMLTISATHKEEKDEKDKDGNYIRRERRIGSFSRSFSVDGIDVDSIRADYKNGVLSLALPKAKVVEPEPKKITIGG